VTFVTLFKYIPTSAASFPSIVFPWQSKTTLFAVISIQFDVEESVMSESKIYVAPSALRVAQSEIVTSPVKVISSFGLWEVVAYSLERNGILSLYTESDKFEQFMYNEKLLLIPESIKKAEVTFQLIHWFTGSPAPPKILYVSTMVLFIPVIFSRLIHVGYVSTHDWLARWCTSILAVSELSNPLLYKYKLKFDLLIEEKSHIEISNFM